MKILLFALIPLQACSQVYKEGTHYKAISDTVTADPEVIEFFSFWCNHCYNFEPLVVSMKKKLEGKAEFKKVHVNFMGFASKELQDTLSKAMLIGRHKKSEAVITGALSNTHTKLVLVSPMKMMSVISLLLPVWTVQNTINFQRVLASTVCCKNNDTINQYRGSMNAVPTFIVNGKYKATDTRNMTPDEMIDLVVYID